MTPKPQHQKQTYTNKDIWEAIKEVKGQVDVLWNDKLVRDAGVAAVDEYKRQEATKSKDSIIDGVKSLMPYIGIIIVAIALILWARSTGVK